MRQVVADIIVRLARRQYGVLRDVQHPVRVAQRHDLLIVGPHRAHLFQILAEYRGIRAVQRARALFSADDHLVRLLVRQPENVRDVAFAQPYAYDGVVVRAVRQPLRAVVPFDDDPLPRRHAAPLDFRQVHAFLHLQFKSPALSSCFNRSGPGALHPIRARMILRRLKDCHLIPFTRVSDLLDLDAP